MRKEAKSAFPCRQDACLDRKPKEPTKHLLNLLSEFSKSQYTRETYKIKLYFCILATIFGCCLVAKLCLTLSNPEDCSTPGFSVLHYLPEFAQDHLHWGGDAIQPSHPLSSHSPFAFNLSQPQGLFQWVAFSHQMAKVLELPLQHQFFQWIFRVNVL